MDIGVITVNESDYHPNRRLLEAAGEKGVRLGLINPYELSPGIHPEGLFMGDLNQRRMPPVLLPRQGAQIGESSLTMLRQMAARGAVLLNDVPAILLARNKYLCLMTLASKGIAVPDTVFINSARTLADSVRRLGGYPVVLKKPSGRQGSGVFLVETEEQAQAIVDAHLDAAQGLMLQQFLPPGDLFRGQEDGRTDLRVLVIGGRVVAAMALAPPPGDFRANFHLSQNSRPFDLPEPLAQTAAASAGALGLAIAGVDLIIDANGAARVIEVNYAPGFKGLEAATGMDIADCIVDYAASFL
jgi:ribosomal protein S6--L-glutamate ligase